MINYRGRLQLNEVGPVTHTISYINGWKEAIGIGVKTNRSGNGAVVSTYQFGVVLDPLGRDQINVIVYEPYMIPGDGGVPVVHTNGSAGVVMASDVDISQDTYIDLAYLEANICASCVRNPNGDYTDDTYRTRYYTNHDQTVYSDDFYTDSNYSLKFSRFANTSGHMVFWFVTVADPGNPASLASASVKVTLDYGSTPVNPDPEPPNHKDYFIYAWQELTYDPRYPSNWYDQQQVGSSKCTLDSVEGSCPSDVDIVYVGEVFAPDAYYEDGNGVIVTNAAQVEDPDNPGTYIWYYIDPNGNPVQLTEPVTYHSGTINWQDISQITTCIPANGQYSSGGGDLAADKTTHYLIVYGYTDDPNGTITISNSVGSWGACLTGDTKISLPLGGWKYLEEIRVGDVIMSENGPTKVTKLRVTQSIRRNRYEFSDGRYFECSPDHRFFNMSKGFFEKMENWSIGDKAWTEDNTFPRLVKVESIQEVRLLYGIWTEDGSYYANSLLSGTTEANRQYISTAYLDKAIDMALSLSEKDLDALMKGDFL